MLVLGGHYHRNVLFAYDGIPGYYQSFDTEKQ
jgi:hypothetical protein